MEEEERITLELPAADPAEEMDEEERIEILLEWSPTVGYA